MSELCADPLTAYWLGIVTALTTVCAFYLLLKAISKYP